MRIDPAANPNTFSIVGVPVDSTQNLNTAIEVTLCKDETLVETNAVPVKYAVNPSDTTGELIDPSVIDPEFTYTPADPAKTI